MDTVQPSSYTRSSVIAAAILLIVLWGFHRTYTVFFPAFDGFLFVQHFHGFMMLLWMLMLIVQPLLIAKRKHRIHRLIGLSSYVIAPLVMLSIFLMARFVFARDLATLTPADAYAGTSLNMPGLIIFGIFYGLAMANRRNTYSHMRYLIGTGFLMIGPGLGRVLITWFGIEPLLGVSATLIAIGVIALIFLLVDVVKGRNLKPYALVAALTILYSVLWEVRYSAPWQAVGKLFSHVLG